MSDIDRLLDGLSAAQERYIAAERERNEAVALLKQLHPANCDGLHHEKRDYHGADERCPILARLDAFLAKVGKGER